MGPQKEILEVQNAIKVYEQISQFKPLSVRSLCQAHGVLMQGLLADAGHWRAGNVGVFHGPQVAHAAPKAKRVPVLMQELFHFMKTDKETHAFIRSAFFHYELEFIHPFSDGNGRIGRLWQTVLLYHFHPIFEFTPIESVIQKRQQLYYKVLGESDEIGSATPFIEFSLTTIYDALSELIENLRPEPLTAEIRLDMAKNKFRRKSFSRKDFIQIFKTISTATASRDLAYGVQKKTLEKIGDKRETLYRFK